MKPTTRKRPPLPYLLLSALSLLFLGLPVHATTVALLTLDETLEQSQLIVAATVQSIESRWSDDGTMIHTYVTFEDLEVIDGQLSDTELTLRFEGGEIGDHSVTTFGVPTFREGRREILMVRDNGSAASPIVGLFQGRFQVVDSLVHDFGGRPIVGVSDGTLFKLNSRASALSNSVGIDAGTEDGDEEFVFLPGDDQERLTDEIARDENRREMPEIDPAPMAADEIDFLEAAEAPTEVVPGVTTVKTAQQKSYPRYIAESADPGTRLTTDEFADYIKSRLAQLRSQASRSDR